MVKTGKGKLQSQVLRYKWLHFLKPFKTFHHHHWYILKQYYIVALVMTACFLPVRLVWYNYVSHSVGTNLGLMTIIALIMLFLVYKNKLGWFGIYFKNRVRRIVFHGIFWILIGGICANIVFYGAILWEIDKGEFYYADVRDKFTALMVYTTIMQNKSMTAPFFELNDTNSLTYMPPEFIEQSEIIKDRLPYADMAFVTESLYDAMHDANIYPSDEAMIWFGSMNATQRDSWFRNFVNGDPLYAMDAGVSIIFYILNHEFGAWGSHYLTVYMVQELEGLGLLLFYRKVYFQKLGIPWYELGLFQKKNFKTHYRRFIMRDKYKTQSKRFIHWLWGFYPTWRLSIPSFANGVLGHKAFNTNHTRLNWILHAPARIIQYLLID